MASERRASDAARECDRYRLALEEIERQAVPYVNLSAHNNVQTIAIIEGIVKEALYGDE